MEKITKPGHPHETTPITPSKISPFFQTVIYNKNIYDRKKFITSLFRKLKKNNRKNKTTSIIWHNSAEKYLLIILKTKELPSWLRAEAGASKDSQEFIANTENSLIAICDHLDHLYIHSSDPSIEDLIRSIILLDWGERKLDIKKLYCALNELELNIKTLGIDNVFGAGGTAAEAKSYFGKDAKLSLAPSFDAGYSFSYCLGSQIDLQGNSNVFGCSIKKRKIWSTWTDGMASFIDQCKKIDASLAAPNNSNFIPLLVTPTEVENPEKLNPLGFYLDYVVRGKGIVILTIDNKNLSEWHCTFTNGNTIQIGDATTQTRIEIKNITNSSIEIKYSPDSAPCVVSITDDETNIRRRKKQDLIDFLKYENNFTILYEEAYAFRENSFWQDNRLRTPFTTNIHTDISWANVDLTKESKPSTIPNFSNIQTRTEEYLLDLAATDADLLAIIRDDGANETADHIAVYKNKLLLIHEKYTSSQNPGLRIEDIQVVASQLVKNIRYLFPTSHKSKSNRLFNNCIYLDSQLNTPEKLIDAITKSLIDTNVQNECWIVQPGISKNQLEIGITNKAHVLLSHLSSICTSNNTKFKLFCSP